MAPAAIAAGVTKIIVNNTGKEEHQAQVAKIAEGKTFADLTAALHQPDAAAALSAVEAGRRPDRGGARRDTPRRPPILEAGRVRVPPASSSRLTMCRTSRRGWSRQQSKSPAQPATRRFPRAMPS